MTTGTEKTHDEGGRVVYRGSGFYVGLVVILVITALLLIFAVQNTQDVQVSFLGVDFTIPVFAVGIGAALVAVVLDEFVGLVWRRHRRHRLSEQAELKRLRRAAERSSRGGEPAEKATEREAESPSADTDANDEGTGQTNTARQPGEAAPTDTTGQPSGGRQAE